MAFYDPRTNEIHGCKAGSLTWWHEKGHQDWFKKGIEQNLELYQGLFLYGLLFSLIVGNQAVSIFLFMIYVMPILISEGHAWYYAFRHKN